MDYESDYEKPSKKKTIIISIIVILIAGLSIFFLIKKGKNSSKGPESFRGFGFSGGGQQITSVKTIKTQRTDLTDFILTNGDIETQVSVEVYPSIGGRVVQVNKSLGDYVNKGEVIAYIDPSEPGTVYAKSPVTASISGTILSSPIKTGQKVNVNSVITKIGDVKNLQIKSNIPERYISELKIGQTAEVTLEAYPDVVFIANVSKISPVVDSLTRTKEIYLTFEKTDSRINAGMFAKVKLFTSTYKNCIIIQQDSIVTVNDKSYLYVVNQDCTVTKREVTLGHNVSGFYEITSGIDSDEIVVTEGMLTLFDGATVSDVSGNAVMPESFDDKNKKQDLPDNGNFPKPDEKKKGKKSSKSKE
jgi:multidrug efflux pump subunit AcrA (membrane-fusion protein)